MLHVFAQVLSSHSVICAMMRYPFCATMIIWFESAVSRALTQHEFAIFDTAQALFDQSRLLRCVSTLTAFVEKFA